MPRSARAGVDIDDGRLPTPQRALVLLTFLLVVAALALFALQGLGGGNSSAMRRVTAAPRSKPKVAAPTTTAPATTLPASGETAGGSATDGTQAQDGPGPGGEPPPADTDAAAAGEQAVPPVAAELASEESSPTTPPTQAGSGGTAWYVTFRGGNPEDPGKVNNVLSYDAEGAPIPTPVLTSGVAGLPLELRELRAMAFAGDGSFFVVNSSQADSKVLAFGAPGPDGTRALLGEYSLGYPLNALNPGIQRPYGLAFDGADNLLVSSEDSQVVTRLSGPGAALPEIPGTPTATLENWCRGDEPCLHYPGTFAPGANAPADPPPPPPGVSSKDGGLKSPRSVVYVSGNHTVYAADNADASVKAYDATTGSFTGAGKGKLMTSADGLARPVGMAVHNGILYVADEGTDAVFALDLITPGATPQKVVAKTEGAVTLDHPSGLALDRDGALYVASRKGRQVARYELSGDGLQVKQAKVFLDDLPDEPEQIVGVPG